MTLRRIAPLVLGVGVAAIVLVAATHLLLIAFEAGPVVGRETVGDVGDWMRDRLRPGPAVLAGVVLVALALWLLVGAVLRVDRPVLTTRRRRGWTKIDRASLADAFERHLEAIDRRNDVDVAVTRRGRVDITIVTPDPSRTGPMQELRDAVDDLCAARDLPCRSGRLRTTVPRRMTGRRRVR